MSTIFLELLFPYTLDIKTPAKKVLGPPKHTDQTPFTSGGMTGYLYRDKAIVFPKIGVPQNGCFIMDPIKMDDLGVPLFLVQHPYKAYYCLGFSSSAIPGGM